MVGSGKGMDTIVQRQVAVSSICTFVLSNHAHLVRYNLRRKVVQ